MKWLYIGAAFVGVALTIAFVYQYLNARFPAPESRIIDIALLLDAVGLGLIFTPIGAMTGITAAFVLHMAWKLVMRLVEEAPGLFGRSRDAG